MMDDKTGFRTPEGLASAHYKVIPSIKSISDLRDIFPDGKADKLNWCFLSTSGVHGTYTTLDDVEKFFAGDEEAMRNLVAEDGDTIRITVLVVHPRMCCIRYGGAVEVQKDDIPWLRSLVASTLEAVAKSQGGNLPAL